MPNSELVQSVLRALDILQLTASHPEGLRIGDVSERLGLKPSTVHNLIRTLRARNFLVQDSDRRVRLGDAPETLLQINRTGELMNRARILLRKLQAKFPDTVFTFSEYYAGSVCCRLRISPDRPGEIQQPFNHTFPFYTSVSGLTLLAFGVFDRTEPERQTPFEEFGVRQWQTAEKLESKLAAIRKRGYAIRCGNTTITLAFPVGERHVIGAHCLNATESTADILLAVLSAAGSELNATSRGETS